MHEMSIARSIVDIVEQEMATQGDARLQAVNITVGKLAAVAPEQLAWWFTIMIAETGLAGATLNVRTVPLGYRCAACRHEFTSEEIALTCPECGAEHPELVSGRELTVESLEVGD